MLLYNHTNNFQTLDSIVEFTKKIEQIKLTGKVNLEIDDDPVLTISAELGDYNLVLSLLNLGADINAIRKSKYAYGNTALIEAARYGHYDIVKLLIDDGANLDTTNYMGNSALMFATLNRHVEVARLLLERGAKVDNADKNNDTPLLISSAKGYFEIVVLLLEFHCNIHHVDNDQDDALILATKGGNYKIVELLSKYKQLK